MGEGWLIDGGDLSVVALAMHGQGVSIWACTCGVVGVSSDVQINL